MPIQIASRCPSPWASNDDQDTNSHAIDFALAQARPFGQRPHNLSRHRQAPARWGKRGVPILRKCQLSWREPVLTTRYVYVLFGPTQSLSCRLVFLNCQRPIKIPKIYVWYCGVGVAFLESLILHSKREWDKLSAKKQQPRAKVCLSAFPLRLLLSLFFCRHDEVACYIHASHIQSLHCRSKYWSSRRDHQPRQLLSDQGEKTQPISQVNDQRPIDPRPWAQEAFPKQREGATTRTVCALTSNAARREGGC